MPSIARLISSFTKSEIACSFKRARLAIRTKGLRILIAQTKSPVGKILIIIPKKCGNSPQRNLLRRRMKAIFYQKKLYEARYNFVVICDKEAIKYSFKHISSLLKRGHARIYHDNT